MDDGVLTSAARLERLFDAQAQATPRAPAVIFRGATIPYGDLAEQAEAMSAVLRRHGLRPGVLAAICVTRTPAMVALLLAVWKAGGAYLPLDPRAPAERAAFMLADSGAAMLVADRPVPGAGAFGGAVLELAKDGTLAARSAGARRPAPDLPGELAYVIYTSGSTGRPKGVMLGHGAVHLVAWARRFYPAAALSRVAATTSLSFDPSIFELFVPLCTGGAAILKGDALEPFAQDEQPTMLDAVPSALAELVRAGAIPPSVLALNVGGEALRRELVRAVQARNPQLTVYNHYGPTEATTAATVAVLPRDLVGEPPIGRPIARAQLRLLDPAGREVGDGEAGEICIGGPGLALGYLGRPELTAERFAPGPGGRLYHTGDIGRWRAGELMFQGRIDRQVKIRGFRVELGEVEAALASAPGVEACAVVLDASRRAPAMVGYVQAPASLSEAAVRAHLAAWLPDYMRPARVIRLDALPRQVSGKLDTTRLPPLDAAAGPPEPGAEGLRPLERPIAHVFEEVLGRTGVGPEDSFFDLGGDSLSSVHAALRLGDVLGRDLPAALIHQAPTPRQLARALPHAAVRSAGHVGLLHPGPAVTDAAPLFCLADLFGHAFNYLGLARRLGDGRAVFGVSPGPLQDAFARTGDIAGLARSMVAEIRRLRPQGPYLLAGYSAGGLLAAEVAAQLERDGQAVSLALLDSTLHSRPPSLRVLLRAEPGSGGAGGAAAAWQLAARLVSRGRSRPPPWVPASQAPFAVRMIRAGLRYRPAPFHGPALVVKARDRGALERMYDADGLLGWAQALRGEVSVVVAAGDHHRFLREPNVAETAQAVGAFLAGETGASPTARLA